MYPLTANRSAAITHATTTVTHDARAMFTATMLKEVNDGPTATADRRTVAAQRLVRELGEISADLRECALLAPDGSLLAGSTGAEWESRAAELFEAASAGGRGRPEAIHVAVAGGEVFAVRARSGHVVIAVAARFALESLMLSDMRAALRSLEDPG